MAFNESLYLAEMKAMVDAAVQQLRTEHPSYEVYTLSIWTDPNAGASAVSFDSQTHSDQQLAKANAWSDQQRQRLLAAGNEEQARLFEPEEGRNTNPADFELTDFAETTHEHLELNWEAESDGACWDVLTPALEEVGQYAFVQAQGLRLHPAFELAVNGPSDWYETTWPKP